MLFSPRVFSRNLALAGLQSVAYRDKKKLFDNRQHCKSVTGARPQARNLGGGRLLSQERVLKHEIDEGQDHGCCGTQPPSSIALLIEFKCFGGVACPLILQRARQKVLS